MRLDNQQPRFRRGRHIFVARNKVQRLSRIDYILIMETMNNLNKYWIVYMTINNVNKKIYVGVHKTSDPYEWDYYLGCGIYANKFYTYEHPKTTFQYAVKKYGPKNFTRKTLAVFNNEEDAFLMESDIVNKEFLSRKDVYNMVLGGKGGDLAEMSVECHMYTLEGEYVKSFNSMQDAADYVNRGRTTIGRGIYQHISAGGYF